MKSQEERRRVTWVILGAVAVIVAFAAADALRSSEGEEASEAAATEEQRVPTTIATQEDSSTEPATTPADGVPRFERLVRPAGGVRVSLRVPTSWERHGVSINKSIVGPQGAEAIIFSAGFPDDRHAEPCPRVLSQPVGPTAADLAALVATAPGTALVAGPSDVMVGGHAAKRVVLTVREDIGCEPGFFYRCEARTVGAFWRAAPVGATIKMWIVEVDGTLLFLAAETSTEANAALKREIKQIVRSIRFLQ